MKSHEIAGAGLDVLCTEPATLDVYRELFALENVVVLPHAYAFFRFLRFTSSLIPVVICGRGGGTEEVQLESCNIAVMTAWSFLRGEGVGPSNIIC